MRDERGLLRREPDLRCRVQRVFLPSSGRGVQLGRPVLQRPHVQREHLQLSPKGRDSVLSYMAEGSAKTKGVGFTNVRAFTQGRFGGDDGWKAVVEKLDDHDREELASVIPVGWYSLEMYVRLIRAVDKVHGKGDLSLMKELGRFEAENDIKMIHRFFLRFTNPAFIIEKTSDYWKRFHDTGTWVVTRDDHGVSAVLDGWGCVDAALCKELVAYLTRTLELAGAKNVLVEHPKCRGRADPQCIFKGRWGFT